MNKISQLYKIYKFSSSSGLTISEYFKDLVIEAVSCASPVDSLKK